MKTKFNLSKINEEVTTSKRVIKEQKESIEVNIKEVLQHTLSDVKSLKGENSLISKKDAIKVIKERYSAIKEIDKDIKEMSLKVCDYVYLGINIKIDEVSNTQFKHIVTLFNKLQQLPTKKDGSVNLNYVKGLENVVNTRLLNNCTIKEMYSDFIHKANEYIANIKG